MKLCSKCDLAPYCSRKCQKKDWKISHILSCRESVCLRNSILVVSEKYDLDDQGLQRLQDISEEIEQLNGYKSEIDNFYQIQ